MQPFRLFDLPRELRNSIYEHLITYQLQVSGGDCHDKHISHTYVRDAPNFNVLLSNRQLSSEYQEQLVGRTKLFMVSGWHDQSWHCPSEPLCNIIEDCTVYGHVVCLCDFDDGYRQHFPCDGAYQLEFYTRELQAKLMKQLTNLRAVHLRLGIRCTHDREYDQMQDSREPPALSHSFQFKQNLKALASLPHVKDIDLVRFSDFREFDEYCGGRPLRDLAIWRAGLGWLSHLK